MEKSTADKGKKHFRFYTEHWKVVAFYLMLYDLIAINAAYFLALWIRFDCRYTMIPLEYLHAYMKFIPLYSVFSIVIFWFLKLYNSLWRFASYNELSKVLCSSVITFVFHTAGITLLFRRMPLTYYFFGPIIQFLLVLGIRFSYRFILLMREKRG